jgi:hypothetical protein
MCVSVDLFAGPKTTPPPSPKVNWAWGAGGVETSKVVTSFTITGLGRTVIEIAEGLDCGIDDLGIGAKPDGPVGVALPPAHDDTAMMNATVNASDHGFMRAFPLSPV